MQGSEAGLASWSMRLTEELSLIWTQVLAFLPNAIGGAVVLLLGVAVSLVIERVARRVLRVFGLDHLELRHRLTAYAGITVLPSVAAAKALFWLSMVLFVLAASHILKLAALTATVESVIAYLPTLLGAAVMALFGVLLVRFVANLATSTAAAAGAPSARSLGAVLRGFGIVLVALVTTEHLGIPTQVLVGPLTALLAVVVLTAGFAFAFGARPVVTHILAGHFLKQTLPRGVVVEVDGQRGVVERIGPTDTLFRNDERQWTVPNGQLLERVVVR